MKNDVELKPCPFCGGTVKMEYIGFAGSMPIAFVQCPKCGACVSFKGKERVATAVKIWNRRDSK
jgi:Lar family restriction alleviation protein